MADYDYKVYSTSSSSSSSSGGGGMSISMFNYNDLLSSRRPKAPRGRLIVSYAQDVATSYNDQTDSIAAPGLVIDLCPTSVDTVVAGSVAFIFGGSDYYDDGSGNLYRDKDSAKPVSAPWRVRSITAAARRP